MEKLIGLALNRFLTTPNSLRETPSRDGARADVVVNLASIYHHYYLDKHGRVPPDPDPAHFEHLQYLTPDPEFRVRGEGLGPSTASRRNQSSELGHAFCRWFLHDHLNITYFAHIEHVLRRAMHPAFGKLTIGRSDRGDTPDYFCAETVDKIFLAEAKGRHSAIAFANKEFSIWRDQFSRVAVKDAAGRLRKVKGYIVATRFATESNPSTKSTIYSEDPDSLGEQPLGRDDGPPLGAAVIASHYAEISHKLNQPILAEALSQGFSVPDEILFPATIWELRIGPLAGTRFVGGYYPSPGGGLPVRERDGQYVFGSPDPFQLDVGWGTFFGVEEKIFRQLVVVARRGTALAAEIPRFEQIQPFYSAISILRDGSAIGPLELFGAVGRFDFPP